MLSEVERRGNGEFNGPRFPLGVTENIRNREMLAQHWEGNSYLKVVRMGTSLAVQWLGLHASTAGGMGSIPGQGTKIPCGVAKKEWLKLQILCYIFFSTIKIHTWH